MSDTPDYFGIGPDERPSAFVVADSANVALVHCAEPEHLGFAALALGYADIKFSPLQGGSGQFNALMCFHENGIPDGFIKRTGEALDKTGIATIAYEPFHDHEFGHSHAFQQVFASAAARHVFVYFDLLVEESDMWDVWLFGPADRLAVALAAAARKRVQARRIDGTDGVMALEVKVRDHAAVKTTAAWLDTFENYGVNNTRRPLPAGSDYEETT
jgi:hypothetical protein